MCHSKAQGSCNHGTQIASLLFAQHGCGPVRGSRRAVVAWSSRSFAITLSSLAVCFPHPDGLGASDQSGADHRAEIINISSGQLSVRGDADPQLEAAVRRCAERGALIVSAAGNEGCDCLHVPAALPDVLVVGALDRIRAARGVQQLR